MNIEQNIIMAIQTMISENQEIYQRRSAFENYCKNQLKLIANLYEFCGYNDYLEYCKTVCDNDLLGVIIQNQSYIEKYYQDLSLEIQNNKKILSYVKIDIINYIKSKSMISVSQIRNIGFDFLTDFYIEFFLDGLTQAGHLEKIQMASMDMGKQNLYKIIQKS